MEKRLSKRLLEIVEALPLRPGVRVLEIGCGSGAAAREICNRAEAVYVLGIDRSAKAIQQAIKASQAEIASARLAFQQVAIEDFEMEEGQRRFDIAFAVRVGALNGRHPEIEEQSLSRIASALTTKGQLFTDGGNPLKEIRLNSLRINVDK